MQVVLVTAGLLAVGSGAVFLATSPTASIGSSCPGSVVFVGALGSGEKATEADPFGPTVSAVWRQFHKRVPSALPHAVKYTAQSLGDSLLKGYAPSYGDGLAAMYDVSYVPVLACRNDPNFRLVYTGFSQGAQVVGDYAQRLISENRGDARELSAIAGIALLGDPRLDSSAQDIVGGGRGPGLFSVPLDYGIEYGPRPKFSGSLTGKERSYCLPQDVVCDTSAFLLSHGLTILGKSRNAATLILQTVLTVADIATVHNKEGSVLGAQAGDFLADKVLASSASPVQTSSTVAQLPSVSAAPPPAPVSTTSALPSAARSSVGASAVATPKTTVSKPQEPPVVDSHAPPSSDPGQVAMPAGASVWAQLDLEKYCQKGWGLHAHVRYPVAWGWQCGAGTNRELGWHSGDQDVSVDDACAEQWRSDAKSHYQTYTDPYSWFCWVA
jgi:cutinase